MYSVDHESRWYKIVELVIEHTPLLKQFAIIIMEYCKEISMEIGECIGTHYPGDVCGYGFFSPCNFTITSLKVDDSYLKGPQSVQIVKFIRNDEIMKNKKIPFIGSIEWESLFHSTDSNDDIISCNIKINKDDVIGIIGHREDQNTPNGVCGPYKTNIYENEVIIVRVTTGPNHTNIPHTKEKNCEIGAGGSGGKIGRIEMWYC
eukprot:475125_1